MAVLKSFSSVLAAAALVVPGVLGFQLAPRDAISNDAYPFCNPATDVDCILNGKYLFPSLEFSLEGSLGNAAFLQYLPTSTFSLTQWTNNKMPQACYHWGAEYYKFNPREFIMYNVTFADCPQPFVVCYHSKAQKTITQIATEISRIPVKLRQSTTAYLAFSDLQADNPAYTDYIAAWSPDGIIMGRAQAYFPAALIHEVTHSMDRAILSPSKPNPWGFGTSFSESSTWISAENADGYAIAAYGTKSHIENFAEAGRAVMLDAVYPGGLAAFTGNNPNLTQISNQLSTFKAAAASYYVTGGTCDLVKKFPYPTVLVDIPPATPTITAGPTATATPYGQCGGWSTYNGPKACGSGYTCTSLNPYYSQCSPTPVARML